jgi:hypothetical protein
MRADGVVHALELPAASGTATDGMGLGSDAAVAWARIAGM